MEPYTPSAHTRAPAVQCLREAVGLMYNATGDLPCYKLDLSGPAAGNSGAWDWQWCSQMMAQELPYYPATGRTDMFWDQVGGMGSVGHVGKARTDGVWRGGRTYGKARRCA